MHWIKALRLDICILAGFLTIISCLVSQRPLPSWIVVIAVVVLGCTTMVQNDWRDCTQDILKKKDFVAKNKKSYFRFLLGCWLVTLVLIIIVSTLDWRLGLMFIIASIICLLYSELKHIPHAALIVTATVSATPALMPLATGPLAWKTAGLFLSVLLLISGREIIKDIEDFSVDRGYKWTIPLKYGIAVSRKLSRLLVIIAFAIAFFLSPQYASIGCVLGIIGAMSPLYRKDSAAKRIIDISAVIVMVGLAMAAFNTAKGEGA